MFQVTLFCSEICFSFVEYFLNKQIKFNQKNYCKHWKHKEVFSYLEGMFQILDGNVIYSFKTATATKANDVFGLIVVVDLFCWTQM